MQLTTLQKEEIAHFLDALEEAFPPEERRTRAAARSVLADPRYHVHVAQKDGKRVGFITLWALNGFAFAEHFVIDPVHRNKGYGGQVLTALKQLYPRLVLEAEPPEDALKCRRLAFYRRNGFFENDIPYLQPSYREGESDVPLVLLSYPDPLKSPESEITEIYRTVYGREYHNKK